MGRTLALYGQTGSGKTTQIGELALWVKQRTGKRTWLNSADPGGYESIQPYVRAGLIHVNELEDDHNPWLWMQDAVLNPPDPDMYGLWITDSATGVGDRLLINAADSAAEGIQIGQQKIYRHEIKGTSITLGGNNESQYGLIQTFMLKQMGRAASFAKKLDMDVVWTFGEHRGESSVGDTIVGPKLVGKALTGVLPRHIQYTLRMVTIPVEDAPARHVLQVQERNEFGGTGYSYANARYPKNADEELPTIIEPASVSDFWELIERAQAQAEEKARFI